MQELKRRDLYTRLLYNRLRLGLAFSLFAIFIMLLSGMIVFVLHKLLRTSVDFWLVLVFFWLFYMAFMLVRYALGGRWIFLSVGRFSSPNTDIKLSNALESSLLASGLTNKIRLLIIPNPDINSFSLSLPDGSYIIASTQGLADKVCASEREAVFAHEISHIMAGDTLIHTIMIRMCGKRALKKIFRGFTHRSFSADKLAAILVSFFAVVAVFLVFLGGNGSDPDVGLDLPHLDFWLLAALLFIVFAAAFPFVMFKFLELVLGKEREYYADMQAVYLTRDPGAVYGVLKHALEDVGDVLLLSPYLDPLLFHPVVDYTSYRAFQTQPTMMQRMQRLAATFPLIDTAR
jgi:Zn-dependent protease with chaperone function